MPDDDSRRARRVDEVFVLPDGRPVDPNAYGIGKTDLPPDLDAGDVPAGGRLRSPAFGIENDPEAAETEAAAPPLRVDLTSRARGRSRARPVRAVRPSRADGGPAAGAGAGHGTGRPTVDSAADGGVAGRVLFDGARAEPVAGGPLGGPGSGVAQWRGTAPPQWPPGRGRVVFAGTRCAGRYRRESRFVFAGARRPGASAGAAGRRLFVARRSRTAVAGELGACFLGARRLDARRRGGAPSLFVGARRRREWSFAGARVPIRFRLAGARRRCPARSGVAYVFCGCKRHRHPAAAAALSVAVAFAGARLGGVRNEPPVGFVGARAGPVQGRGGDRLRASPATASDFLPDEEVVRDEVDMGEPKPSPLKLDPARQIPGVAAGATTILSPDQVQAADEQEAHRSGGGTPEQASGNPPGGGGAGRGETDVGPGPGGSGAPPAHRPPRSAETAAGRGTPSSPEPSRSGQERPDGRQYQERRTAFARAGFVATASSDAGGAKPPRLGAEAAGSLQHALGFVREGDPVDPDLEAELYEELRSVGVNPRLYVGQLAEITDAQRRGGVNAYELQYMFADALQQLQALVKRAAASSDLRLREAEDLGPQVFKVVRFLRTSAEHLNEKLSALDTTVDAKREQLLQAFHNDVQSLLGDVSRMDELLRGSEKLVLERVDAFGAGMQARIVEYLAKVESATEGLHKKLHAFVAFLSDKETDVAQLKSDIERFKAGFGRLTDQADALKKVVDSARSTVQWTAVGAALAGGLLGAAIGAFLAVTLWLVLQGVGSQP